MSVSANPQNLGGEKFPLETNLLGENSLAAASVMYVVTKLNKRPVKRLVGKAKIGSGPFIGPFPADY